MTKLDRLFLRLEKDGFTVQKNTITNINNNGENAPVLIIDNVRSIKPHQRGRNHSHTCPEYPWTIQ